MSKPTREELHERYLSESHRLLFNEFIVDSFKYKIKKYKYFLLSHFHSDHYGGIKKKWDCGTIIGTKITLSLVKLKFDVEDQYLHIIDFNSPMFIQGQDGVSYELTAINAGHAPGSCCFLIKRMSDGLIYLHVGDFRFDSVLQNDDGWKKFVFGQPIDTLFLDTTYADPEYTFKERQIVCNEGAKIVKENLEKTLFIVFTYTIGKEMFAEEIARKNGLKIHVDEKKYEILDLCKRDMSLYTTEESCLEMAMKNKFGSLNVKLASLEGKYDRIITFEPTGWAKKTSSKGSFNIKEYELPYSEHSSFNELVDCFRIVKAKNVVPTVVVQGGQTADEIVQKISKASKPKPGTMDAYFRITKRSSSSKLQTPQKVNTFHDESPFTAPQ